jgi:ketopantoate reductase
MEHAVLGAGAIGGLVATAVASLGEGVTVLVRPQRLPGYPATLSVERPSGVITAPAKVAVTAPNPIDVLWIATKTYQL